MAAIAYGHHLGVTQPRDDRRCIVPALWAYSSVQDGKAGGATRRGGVAGVRRSERLKDGRPPPASLLHYSVLRVGGHPQAPPHIVTIMHENRSFDSYFGTC